MMNSFETVKIEHCEIGDYRYNKVMGKIKRAANLAAKHGVPAPTVISEREFTDKEFIDSPLGECQQAGVRGFWRYFTSVELTLDRKIMKVEGYTPVVHIDNDGIISRLCDPSLISDDELIKIRNEREDNFVFCDHCKTSRRRNMVVVCRKDGTGDLVSFGKECLKVVTGLHITDSFLNPRAFNLDDEYDSWNVDGPARFEPFVVLAVGLYVISKHGYVSNSAVRNGTEGPSTSDIVKEYLGDPKMLYTVFGVHGKSEAQYNHDKLEAIYDWVLNHEGSNNYMLNLKIIFGLEYVKASHIGYIVSAIVSKQHEDNRKAEQAEQPESNHVGEIGERIYKETPIKAQLRFVRYMDNQWGATTLMKFVTENGDILTWFASGYYEVEAGDACTISGATVKRHSEFNGQKETGVNRVKLEWAS